MFRPHKLQQFAGSQEKNNSFIRDTLSMYKIKGHLT